MIMNQPYIHDVATDARLGVSEGNLVVGLETDSVADQPAWEDALHNAAGRGRHIDGLP